MARILLVEDDDDFRVLLAQYLRESGHDLSEARGGIEAFHKFDIFAFDLLITDLIMAEGDGVDLIARMHVRFPALPIIAISGGSSDISPEYLAVLAEQLGAVAFLAKPLQLTQLEELVGKHVGSPLAPPEMLRETPSEPETDPAPFVRNYRGFPE